MPTPKKRRYADSEFVGVKCRCCDKVTAYDIFCASDEELPSIREQFETPEIVTAKSGDQVPLIGISWEPCDSCKEKARKVGWKALGMGRHGWTKREVSNG